MTYGAHTEPSSIETWLEARMPGYRYGAVLVLLAMTFIVMAAGPPDGYTRVITVTLQGLTLMASLLASRVSRRLFRIAAIVTLLAFIAAVASLFLGSNDEPNAVFFLLNVLLVATVPVVIARALWRRGTVDIHTVMGAICIYVLLGMMFAFIYAAIDAMSSGAFFVQTANPTPPDFLYFSFITQTTVGYGDFTASGDLGRALAVLEALTGQLYLVTIIAVLVSRLSARVRPANTPIEAAAQPQAADTPDAAQPAGDPSA